MKVRAMEDHAQAPVKMEGASGARMRMLVGPDDGAANFHMRQFEIEPGGYTPHHKHDYEHEIVVLGGAGIVKSESGDRPFKAGDVIFVPPNEMHQFQNPHQQPCSFICLIPAPRDCSE